MESYRSRISGPILDRFDLHVVLPRVELDALRASRGEETSDAIRARVSDARRLLGERGRSPRDAHGVLDRLELARAA